MDPRSGDTILRTHPIVAEYRVQEDAKALGVSGRVYGVVHDLDHVLRGAPELVPRCIAADPRAGDTVTLGAHPYNLEVVRVDGVLVHTIDPCGMEWSYSLAEWTAGAAGWLVARDRKGGARFDPQEGDTATVGKERATVVGRTPEGAVQYTKSRSLYPPVLVAPLDAWASDNGIFSVWYVQDPKNRHPVGTPE